jgi:outer membrane immunogenic protein
MRFIPLTGASLFGLVVAVTPVAAADMPVKAPITKAAALAPVFNWTGFYAGVHAGYGWGDTRIVDVGDNYGIGSSCACFEWDFDGALGGVQAGYRWQSGSIVYGGELDFSFSGMQRRLASPLLANEFFETDIKWFGTGRVSVGYAVDRGLIYITGGFAYADVESRYDDPLDSNFAVASKVKWGGTAGAGVEYAFAPNWSLRAEYLYVDLGTIRGTFFDPGPFHFDFDNRFHVARAALNYRFATGKSPAPVVTKY